MERELLMAGIGGQGVQLAAQLLAKAATGSGRHAQLFGSYGGMMRGGNTDATLIIGDEPIQSPPMVSSAWSALIMHHEYAAPATRRVKPGGIVVINTSIVTESMVAPTMTGPVTVLALPASELAIGLGAAAAATMVALGAYAAATGIVTIDALIATLTDVLPSYRRQHVESNTQALLAGARAGIESGVAPAAWPAPAGVSA